MKYFFFLIGALLANPSSGQDLSFDPTITEVCLDNATIEPPQPGLSQMDKERACIGVAADICMETTAGGFSTVGMGGCLNAELEWWDARLNRVYAVLRDAEQEIDTANAGSAIVTTPLAPSLRDMQRAWIAFRNASCLYEYAQWGGGTGGGPASAACLMEMTAEQTLSLEARLAEKSR